MSKTILSTRSALLAAATALAAGGWIAGAAPAQGLPPAPLAPGDCQQWGFPGLISINQSTGEVLTFNSTGPTAAGPADLKQGNGATKHGTVSGGIDANGHITLNWSGVNFTGDVGPDGSAHGTRDPNNEVTWNASTPMKCTQQTPKEGPTVSWDPIIGGLVAHITDRSGVTSQCTYTSDFYTRSFRLEANKTVDLKIVPAIPKFDNWNVNIKCDNGTETNTTTFF